MSIGRLSKRDYSFKEKLGIFIVFLLAISIPISMYAVQNKEDIYKLVGAKEAEAKLFILPKENQIDKGASVNIAVKAIIPDGSQMSSIFLVLSYDKSHLKLKEIKQDEIDNKIRLLKSSIADANTIGKVKVFLGAGSKEIAPAGLVNLIRLNFEVLSNAASEIRIDPAESQVVFIDGKSAKIKVDNNAKVDSNIVASTAPTVVATPTVAPLPPTLILTTAPTISVSPTVMSTIIPTDTISPSPISTSSATPD